MIFSLQTDHSRIKKLHLLFCSSLNVASSLFKDETMAGWDSQSQTETQSYVLTLPLSVYWNWSCFFDYTELGGTKLMGTVENLRL